ncbi:MAG: alpha/beta hydrolase [Chloroflexi bacterium]|nr:alpha/beta hydrolase [Chloroflexota bacterium]
MKTCLRTILVLALLVVPALALAQAGDITLVPFTNEIFGVQGVVPEGWQMVAPGIYARGSGPADLTVLAQQSAPVTIEQLEASLLPQLGLTAMPEPVETLDTGAFVWTVYRVEVSAGGVQVVVDVAVAAGENQSYVVLLQGTPEDYPALHEAVFLPALNALALFEATPEAVEDVPYLQEEVTFENGDVTLAGTLTLPQGDGPHPALVLVSGSGQQDRDESLPVVPGYRPFRDIADDLTRRGIAVLRYDDRGVGGSTGDPSVATTADFATDAAAAVGYLHSRDDINPGQIGLLGHSEGGIIAAILGASDPNLAFVIMLSGPGLSGREVSLFQNIISLEQSGVTGEPREAILGAVGRAFDAAAAGDMDATRAEIENMSRLMYEAVPDDIRALLGSIDSYVEQTVEQQMATFQSPWFQFFLAYDPALDWSKTTIPVLAIFGGLDKQVEPESNAAALEAALEQAGNADYSIVTIPDANHLYQPAVTGYFDEYASLGTELHPDLLPTIADWLLERVDVAG